MKKLSVHFNTGGARLMKKVMVILMAVALFATVAMSAGNAEDVQSYSFKVSTNHTEDHPTTQALYKFAEKLKAASKGKIELKVYTGAQLGEETEVIENCRQGIIDFIRVSAGNMSSFDPMMDIFSVPYLFKDSKHYWKVLNGDLGMEIMNGLEEKGLKGIVYYDGGARSFYNRVRPIRTPADMKGMKVRVMPSKTMLSAMEALGAKPTSTSFAEVYSALQTGVIEAAENNTIGYYTMNHHEVAKYYSLDEHMRIPDMLIMNLKKWNSMPKSVQKIIIDAAKASQDYQIKAWGTEEKKALQALRSKGVKMNRVEKAPFQKAVASLVESLKPQFKGLIEKIQAVN